MSLDRFLAGVDYPMYVVTVAASDDRAGCLVGFVTQCSIDPARFVVCLSKNNATYRVARTADRLGVHLLDETQRDLAALFGGQTGDDVDKFVRCAWRPGPDGVPVLTDCARWFVADVLERVDLGDHVGFVLAPTEVHADGEVRPLQFSQVRDLQAAHPA